MADAKVKTRRAEQVEPGPGTENVEPQKGDGDTPPDFTAQPNADRNGEAKAPPKDEKPKREKAAPTAPRARRQPPLQKQLEDTFATLSLAIMATGDEYCARHVANQAAPLSEAWADLAKVNPRVDAMLRRLMQGSAWSAVIITTAATVIPMAAHHGVYPKGFPMPFEFGLGPPPPPSPEVQRERTHGDTPAEST
jgi:hypothetical protein